MTVSANIKHTFDPCMYFIGLLNLSLVFATFFCDNPGFIQLLNKISLQG